MAQLVKNPPAMWETWVRSLSWEDPSEKGRAIHSSIVAWRIPWTVQKKSDTTERLLLSVKWMNLEPVIQSEVSQKEKNKYHK